MNMPSPAVSNQVPVPPDASVIHPTYDARVRFFESTGSQMPAPWPLNFGVFYAPFHPVGQDPTLALEYDLERVVELDRLGFDEAWFGEHPSGGYEIIGSPLISFAVAAPRPTHLQH